MNAFQQHFQGRLPSLSASLLIALSGELLKWQFPAYAAGEKLSELAAALRNAFFPLASRFLHN